jgi:hypothetical protein
MTIAKILIGLLCVCILNSGLLISKNGIGDVTFNRKLSDYNKKNYYKVDKRYMTDEVGDSTYYVTLFLNKNHYISIEADADNKEVYGIETNVPDFYTADSIRVGSTFEQLINKYDGLVFLDGEGGEIVPYLKRENLLFYMSDLSFRSGFNYEDRKRKLEKSALLKYVKNKKVTVKSIKVVKYAR